MICPSCNEVLKVTVNRSSSEEGMNFRVQAKCPKCKAKSSPYHIAEEEDIELASTAAQREISTRYEITIDDGDGNGVIPPLSVEEVAGMFNHIKHMVCQDMPNCGACPFNSRSSKGSKVMKDIGFECDLTSERRMERVSGFLRDKRNRFT